MWGAANVRKEGRVCLGSHLRVYMVQHKGKRLQAVGAVTTGCGSSNNRLLAHISMDQKAEIKTGSMAKLENSAPPHTAPLAPLPKDLTQQHSHQLGTGKVLITRTYVSTFYSCTISFCSWPPWAQRQVIKQKSFKYNFKIRRIFF